MGRPTSGYTLKDGTPVPGVTTILGRFKDSGGLLHWAFKQGKEGKATLYEERDKAADIGTMAHDLVEAHIKGTLEKEWPERCPSPASFAGQPQDKIDKARNAFRQYLEWEQAYNVEITGQEMPLVSEEHKFGGTPDAIGRINGRLVLLDWKTSKGVYLDYLIQLGAYRLLLAENGYGQMEEAHLCRFAKDFPDFEHRRFGGDLELAERQFLLLRTAYENDKELKKRVA